jgi:hypothetical protein
MRGIRKLFLNGDLKPRHVMKKNKQEMEKLYDSTEHNMAE